MQEAGASYRGSLHLQPARRWRHTLVLALILGTAATLILLDVFLSEHNRQWQFEPVEGVTTFQNLDTTVTEQPITYAHRPPVAGPLAPVTQACGIYRVPVSDPHAAAALATGAVWLAYRPDLPQAEIDALYDWAIGKRDLILAPYDDLFAPIVITAWGKQLAVENAADERLVPFFQQYKNAQSAPSASAHCIDGLGVPGP